MEEKPQEAHWSVCDWVSTLFCQYYKGKLSQEGKLNVPSPITVVVSHVCLWIL